MVYAPIHTPDDIIAITKIHIEKDKCNILLCYGEGQFSLGNYPFIVVYEIGKKEPTGFWHFWTVWGACRGWWKIIKELKR